jgi:hypothetical protein
MNRLIRYKDKSINLNNVFYIQSYLDNYVEGTRYNIQFNGIGGVIENYEHETTWGFKNIEEGEQVYNYILNTYFTDIEKEMNK